MKDDERRGRSVGWLVGEREGRAGSISNAYHGTLRNLGFY